MEDWTEKYRPQSLDEIIGNEKAIIQLRNWALSWNKGIPKKRAVILSGKAGTGKTTSALALANDLGWTSIELNTSDARNAEKIKHVATYGALNETFTDEGNFISSQKGGRKLIVLDEADNLYEKSVNTSNPENDLSDRGGKKAIIETIKNSNQPIILIVNDYYQLIKGGGESFKNLCMLIRFYNPYSSQVFGLLKRICLKEGINCDQKALKILSDRCKGDIRSAVNDLQALCLNKTQVDVKSLDVLGYRDRDKEIFDALREVFKTKNIQTIKESMSHLDLEPGLVLLWINENLPGEYKDLNDLVKGYGALSKADIFLGRTYKKQNYSLWSYTCDIMNGGVANAKTHVYPNDRYGFPTWLRQKKGSKSNLEAQNSIISKLSNNSHNSIKKNANFLTSYFIHIFRNDTNFAIKMKNKYDFNESEIKYLLGDKQIHKLKEIMQSKPIIVKPEEKIEEKINTEKEEKGQQQSLFDF